MQFKITLPANAPAFADIEDALLMEDPMAVLALQQDQAILDIATCIESPHLLPILQQAGCNIDAHAIHQLPSLCCGECST